MLKMMAGAMVAAGLCLAGCGGGEMPGGEVKSAVRPTTAAEAKAQAQAIRAAGSNTSTTVQCTDEEWRDIFWSDATYTTAVGFLACDQCFGFETSGGIETDFITLDFEFKCSNQ
ncbi:MAG TPA: hypothetical protein VH083_20200 [Myxococcales bacterium]|jgi:hypothetical protein|nr:hypothetical protein [Myxococcales bacterium]